MKKSKPKRKSNNANTVLPAVPTYSISKKKVEELYGIVHEEIMQVRIKLCNLSDKDLSNQVNDILADLCFKAPEKAINVFRHGR